MVLKFSISVYLNDTLILVSTGMYNILTYFSCSVLLSQQVGLNNHTRSLILSDFSSFIPALEHPKSCLYLLVPHLHHYTSMCGNSSATLLTTELASYDLVPVLCSSPCPKILFITIALSEKNFIKVLIPSSK